MKRTISFLLFTFLLTGCGSNTSTLEIKPPDMAPGNNAPVNAQAATNMMESFKAYIQFNKPDILDKTGFAEVLMNVKSLMGKQYTNKSSATRYYLNIQSGGMPVMGKIRLGKDGNLYFENSRYNTNTGKLSYEYFAIGNYVQKNYTNGDNVDFKLNKGISLKMKWRGLNPMNHDEIHLNLDSTMPPYLANPTEFLK
jgi:hypothetical protein